MRGHCIRALGICFFLAVTVFGQAGINATLSGTVTDATGAVIPGVQVQSKNTGTGVTSTTLTNESGTYRFPSLQPGNYEAGAPVPGFQTQTFRLALGGSPRLVQN